jgi:hypothetical protein
MKEAWKRCKDGLNASTGFIVQEGVPRRWWGSPQQESWSPQPLTDLE